MSKRNLTILFFIVQVISTRAQDIPSFLKSVSENNPEILANKKLLEARKAEARTNLTPSDPFISFAYMPGNTAAIGTKKIWSVNQSFSFPTKYLQQKKLNAATVILAEQELNYGILLTLLEAKLNLYDLIYYKKWLTVLNSRKELYSRLQTAWRKMLDTGEATIMEYNKISLELSSVELQINHLETGIRNIITKLTFMSGQSTPIPSDTDYPSLQEIDLAALISEKKSVHPAFLLPQTEFLISQGEVRLSKSSGLPEFQIGYGSEIVPGETYSGPTAGISIPLWSNSFKTRTAVAKSSQLAAARDAELLRLSSEVAVESETYLSLKRSYEGLDSNYKLNGDTKFLDKALDNNDISLIEYSSYLKVAWDIKDKLLEMENEFQKAQVKLFDHKLLKWD